MWTALLSCTLGVVLTCMVARWFGLVDDLTHKSFWTSVALATLVSWGLLAILGGW
jgi:hypothetical protein